MSYDEVGGYSLYYDSPQYKRSLPKLNTFGLKTEK